MPEELQAFSQILHQLTGQESRRSKARNAALQDLSALLEATECDTLFEGSDASLRGMPQLLGQVAEALGKYAAPPSESEGRDDYQTENRILGVRCLHHIVLNVPAADLLQYNRAQVVYHALFNHLYTPEHHLIQAVLPCLLDLFPILEKALHWKGGAARPTTHCDEVLQLVLTHMEPEHRLLLRRTYARNLPAFVKRLGILTVRHLKRLERVIVGYLEVYDGPEEEARLKILETLKLLMQYTWPRYHSQQTGVLRRAKLSRCSLQSLPSCT
ncbi:hypothetical protein CB1_015160014 [Camelus ferus]|nr:hypothetical protein CB1_015160014 [Camelus ferus]